jgi:hypothetical protein
MPFCPGFDPFPAYLPALFSAFHFLDAAPTPEICDHTKQGRYIFYVKGCLLLPEIPVGT